MSYKSNSLSYSTLILKVDFASQSLFVLVSHGTNQHPLSHAANQDKVYSSKDKRLLISLAMKNKVQGCQYSMGKSLSVASNIGSSRFLP